jgi:hypothetical protein
MLEFYGGQSTIIVRQETLLQRPNLGRPWVPLLAATEGSIHYSMASASGRVDPPHFYTSDRRVPTSERMWHQDQVNCCRDS